MNDVVVVGATGFIGRYLIASISCQKEIKFRVLVHRNTPEDLFNKDNITVIRGDLLRLGTLDKLCEKNAIVINLVYLRNQSCQDNLAANNNLLEACVKAKISRFIHCSTTAVFGKVSSDVVTENTKCDPINEYEITKLQIEEAVLKRASSAFDAVILRPTAVFGPGGKNLLKLANDLRSGNKIANYLKACLYNMRKMNLVSVHNVVAAIKLLMQTDKKINREVFIVSDDEFQSNNYSYIERYLLKSLGLTGYPLPVVPVPYFVLKMLLRLTGKSNFNPRCTYNCQKLLNLGFKKTVLFEDGLADFANWYKHYLEVQKSVL
ncbi:MAG: NAD-dependent epimerase/dehydratase family protein [Candidatus Omnitrophota bacterium]